MSKVVIIRTIPGEELISELVMEHDNGDATVSRPRVFAIMPTEDGEGRPSISPWIVTDPDNKQVVIRNHYIATIVEAPVQIEKAYLQSVTNIQLA